MPTQPSHKAVLKALNACDFNKVTAAKKLEVDRGRLGRMLAPAALAWGKGEGAAWVAKQGLLLEKAKIVDVQAPTVAQFTLEEQVKQLKRALAERKHEAVTAEYVREALLGLSKEQPQTPKWVNDRYDFEYHHGIPTLMLSDLHVGEKVFKEQVFGINEYDNEIAEARIRRCVDKTIMLCKSALRAPEYPGIVLVLGGDNISGMIHPELIAGADGMVMRQVEHVSDILHGCILKLVKEFGRVFIPGVPGNHGRDTMKPWAKFNAETNFDWLVYQFLERYLAPLVLDGTVVFMTPPARDITYKVAGRRFRLTHGDQFRGGDGIIGALGPITRGDKKKRAMAMTMPHDDEQYETILMGHFHTLFMRSNLIINGSTKGYDEYAMSCNFEYEPPQQALFLTHEKYGINHYMPVLADNPQQKPASKWVEFKETNTFKGKLASTLEWIKK